MTDLIATADRHDEFDTSGFVRRARRLGDLSQRELAAALGIGQTGVARIEAGGHLDVQRFAQILALGGLRLVVVDERGEPVGAMPEDVFIDRAGRRRPAHLDVHATPEPPTTRMLLRRADAVPEGGVWHHRRDERDWLRRRSGEDGHSEQLTAGAARARRRRQGEHGRYRANREHSTAARQRAEPESPRDSGA